MVFVIFGFVIGDDGLNLATVDAGHAAIHIIAEFTLILVLFTDAARIDLNQVRRDHNLPVRMLLIGMPLTILLPQQKLGHAFSFQFHADRREVGLRKTPLPGNRLGRKQQAPQIPLVQAIGNRPAQSCPFSPFQRIDKLSGDKA